MVDDETDIKVPTSKTKEVYAKALWVVPWTAGFLFTLGYVGMDVLVPSVWYVQALSLILVYILWPMFLGLHLHG